ncbi:hypothetical protein HDC95_000640 [Microbacterium sp. AK031]|nr:hypothetical protein [Microbacterium sp. AK031]
MTSFTPPSPRAFRLRRKLVQNGCDSVSPTSKPKLHGGRDTDRDDDSLRDDPPADPSFAIGRIEEHIRIRGVGEGPVAERDNILVQVRADPRHLGFGDAGVRAERFHEVIDLASAHTVNIGLHDHREHGLINTAAPLQQRREEGPLPQPREPQLEIPSRGRQGARAGAIALRGPRRSALERGGADERGRFRIDQLLIERFRRDTDPVR